MKRVGVLILVLSLTIFVRGFGFSDINGELPQKIKEKIEQLYPSAKDLTWDEKNSKYFVQLFYEEKMVKIAFDDDGEILKSEEEITFDEIPQTVKNKLSKKYPSYEFDDLKVVKKGNTTNYAMKASNGKNSYDLILNSKAKFTCQSVSVTRPEGNELSFFSIE